MLVRPLFRLDAEIRILLCDTVFVVAWILRSWGFHNKLITKLMQVIRRIQLTMSNCRKQEVNNVKVMWCVVINKKS